MAYLLTSLRNINKNILLIQFLTNDIWYSYKMLAKTEYN